ncbi:MAG: 1-acyl-sn-glycerol-3-phosphate acyltransferase [Pseudonocardiales bacterium]|jgi:1-acyl-sn-glycerol-3-phosphate acyltransferase|nr:1-acyl-sn-glycerol-3-phosphate acyltransferase [Pseudonocardiales bacterium]
MTVLPERALDDTLDPALADEVAPGSPDLPPGASPRLHDLARRVGTAWLRPVLRVRVHGADRIPATGPLVLVANHSALVDGPLLFGLLGRRAVFLVKREMFRGPLAVALVRMGQLPVRRGAADPAPLRAAVAVLRGGGLVGVFPEGRRGSGDVTAAHHGAAWLARTTGASVLPVVIRGTRRTSGSRPRIRPRVDVLVGTPLAVFSTTGRAELAAATETVRAALAGLVVDLDRVRVQQDWAPREHP